MLSTERISYSTITEPAPLKLPDGDPHGRVGDRQCGGMGPARDHAEHCSKTRSFVNPHLYLCKVWTLPMKKEEALKKYQGDAVGKVMFPEETVDAAMAELLRLAVFDTINSSDAAER